MTAGARCLVIDRRFHVSKLLLVELLTSSDMPLHAGLVLDRNGLPSSVHCIVDLRYGDGILLRRGNDGLGWSEVSGMHDWMLSRRKNIFHRIFTLTSTGPQTLVAHLELIGQSNKDREIFRFPSVLPGN